MLDSMQMLGLGVIEQVREKIQTHRKLLVHQWHIQAQEPGPCFRLLYWIKNRLCAKRKKSTSKKGGPVPVVLTALVGALIDSD